MLPSESNPPSLSWASLPMADPPAHLRDAVLMDWQRAHGRRTGRFAGGSAALAIAALFVLAVALPLRMQNRPSNDPTIALLRAQGLEVAAPPTPTMPAQVRRVVDGSAAARLGLRAGDRLLAIDLSAPAGGMMNVMVLRGDSAQYFALPNLAGSTFNGGAGMALVPEHLDMSQLGFGRATLALLPTSFLKNVV